MATKKAAKKTAKKTIPKKSVKAKAKAKPKGKPIVFADVYSEAARLIELDAANRTADLLQRGKGVVPMELLTGIRLFTPLDVWNGLRVPTEPTSELGNIAAYLVRCGMTADTACRAMGITTPEFHGWVERGVRDIQAGHVGTPCAKFVRILDMADAQDELRDMTTIAVQGGAAGAMWKRERKSKSRWGKQNTVSAIVNITGGVKERDAEELIPDAAEVLYNLEQAGYTALPGVGVTIEAEVNTE